VIFSGWLCSLLGRNAQGAYANQARSRFYLLPEVTKRVPSALVSIMAGYPALNNFGLGAE
jgi:hypothetical protein